MPAGPIPNRRLLFSAFVAPLLLTAMLSTALPSHAAGAPPAAAKPGAKEKDITAQVRRATPLDERLREMCESWCQGNQRAGTLRAILVRRLGPHRYAVTGLATLLSQHAFANGYRLFSYTVEIEAKGLLDSRSCDLTVTDAAVRNDRVGLNKLAAREVGRTHRIKDCRRFLAGL